MITSLTIEGLRGILGGTIEGLAPVTFFVGPNGCGKTTVLEGAGVACALTDSLAAFRAVAGRHWLGVAGMDAWLPSGQVRVRSKWSPPTITFGTGMTERDTRIELRKHVVGHVNWTAISQGASGTHGVVIDDSGEAKQRPTPAETRFAALRPIPEAIAAAVESNGDFSSVGDFGAIEEGPQFHDLLKYLRQIRPTLEDIRLRQLGKGVVLYMYEGPPRRGYPLSYAGDGFARAVRIAGTLARAKGGVATIDEPEAFAHPVMFDSIAALFPSAVADGTQVLMATHSLEFIRATLRVFAKDPSKVSVIGLRLIDGILKPTVVAGSEAFERVIELGDDLRM